VDNSEQLLLDDDFDDNNHKMKAVSIFHKFPIDVIFALKVHLRKTNGRGEVRRDLHKLEDLDSFYCFPFDSGIGMNPKNNFKPAVAKHP